MIIPQSSRKPQNPSKDTTACACVWLAVPALQVPNAIRYDLQPPSALDVHSEQSGPLLTGKSRNITLQGLQTMSTNTNSIHREFRLILRWQHPQSQVNDAQGVLCYIQVVKTSRVSSQPSPLTSTQAQYNSSAVRQPINRIYEQSQIGIRNVRQWTVQSTIQDSTRHNGSRVFFPSFPIFKSLKHTRHNAETYHTLLQALIWYITLHENLFFRNVESFN
jgi:hypothetical protein